jgi:hypothetical protein
MTGPAALLGASGRLIAAAATAVAVMALFVGCLGGGPWAQSGLGLRSPEPARELQAAVEVATTNLRLLAAVLVGAIAIQQLPALRAPVDLALGTLAALNLAVAALALGADGVPLLTQVALHGTLELAAFAIAASAYLAARQGALGPRALVSAAGLAVALLSLGALAETYLDTGALR